MIETSLKPCPFCGSNNVAAEEEYSSDCGYSFGGHSVVCNDCETQTKHYETQEEAVEAWNKRTKELTVDEQRIFHITFATYDNFGQRIGDCDFITPNGEDMTQENLDKARKQIADNVPCHIGAPVILVWQEYDKGLTMTKNKMSQIAALFGKKLNEEFTVKKDEYKARVKITEDGLAYAQPITREFDDELLVQMIKGSAEIVEGT